MIIEKITSEGIAHYSYYIGSGLEAAVIDPRRDVDAYIQLSKTYNQKIISIFETHRNEDYTVGSLELSKITGARIYHGSKLDFTYGEKAFEGDVFKIGNLEIGVLETPGHTDESLSFTLKEQGETGVFAVFTGDTLFAGDVGRTDLYGERHVKRLSEALYESLFERVLKLGDGVVVLPGHGAGSVCGGNISVRGFTTIGYEKKTNRVLKIKDRDDFVKHKLNERLERPPYFKRMEIYNREGPPVKGLPNPKPLSVKDFKQFYESEVQIVDVRTPDSFASAHIPGSVNIWASGLPLFAGWILNYEDPIIIVKDNSQNMDSIVRYLFRLGFDGIEGYLNNIFDWYKSGEPVAKSGVLTVTELKEKLFSEEIFLLDVRDERTYSELGFIKNAYNIYVGHLKDRLNEIPDNKMICVYCDSGFKTSIAVSLLLKKGFRQVSGVLGGFSAWIGRGYPVEQV
ncbi:MAG: MBL fold metallo-hydrolase [Candidatus Odinarchaeota archaeon]